MRVPAGLAGQRVARAEEPVTGHAAHEHVVDGAVGARIPAAMADGRG